MENFPNPLIINHGKKFDHPQSFYFAKKKGHLINPDNLVLSNISMLITSQKMIKYFENFVRELNGLELEEERLLPSCQCQFARLSFLNDY